MFLKINKPTKWCLTNEKNDAKKRNILKKFLKLKTFRNEEKSCNTLHKHSKTTNPYSKIDKMF